MLFAFCSLLDTIVNGFASGCIKCIIPRQMSFRIELICIKSSFVKIASPLINSSSSIGNKKRL